MMADQVPRGRQTLSHLKDVSMRGISVSEKVVERGFNEARLLASLAVGLMLVGFLLVAQWRGNASATESLEGQSDQNLAIIIEELTTQNMALRNDVARLEARVFDAERTTKDSSELLNEATREIAAIRAISGVDGVSGPGVEITINDPERVLLAQDFVALMNELRSGGAEAVAVNGVRVTGRTGFRGSDGSLTVGRTTVHAPYTVTAIGDPANLKQSLELPGGLESTFKTFPGVTVGVARADNIDLPAGADMAFVAGSPNEE